MTERFEQPEDAELAHRLASERPVPSAGYRARVRADLLASLPAREARPRRVRLLIAAYAGSGALLLVVAAVGVAGAGPLSA